MSMIVLKDKRQILNVTPPIDKSTYPVVRAQYRAIGRTIASYLVIRK
jgi:hypothetical protein